MNFAFRLLAAPVAKQRLRESGGLLAVVVSEIPEVSTAASARA